MTVSARTWGWIGAAIAVAFGLWLYTRLSEPTLVGTWSNRAVDAQRVTFSFGADGLGSMVLGGAELRYRYRFDRSRRPAWLDLDARVDGKPVTIRAIAEFSRGNKLKIRLPPTRTPGTRPTEFLENDLEDTILLTRGGPGS